MDPWLSALIGAGVLALALAAAGLVWWLWRRVAKGAPGKVEAPPIGADLQDPLPESNWLWRRILFIGAALAQGVAYGFILWKVGQLGAAEPAAAIEALVSLGLFVTVMIVADRLLYTIAPSAEQITKWFNVISLLKGGVSLFSRATATSAEGTATSTVEARPAASAARAPRPRVSAPPVDDPTSYGGPRE